jgi:hypothetical protein
MTAEHRTRSIEANAFRAWGESFQLQRNRAVTTAAGTKKKQITFL